VKIKFFPDEPLNDPTNDDLALNQLVSRIVVALEHTQPPFVFGLLGDWGVGKTSCLALLEHHLKQDKPHLVPVRFNPWMYENDTNMVYPLLHTIRSEYMSFSHSQPSEDRFLNTFKRIAVGSVLAITNIGIKTLTQSVFGVTLGVKEIGEHIDSTNEVLTKRSSLIEASLHDWTNSIDDLRKGFDELINIYRETVSANNIGIDAENVRIIILLDDLDRCLPEVAIRIIESIKNFFSVPGCIFILAINPEVIEQGIRLKYNGLDISGRRYLEKILNYSFRVPVASPEHMPAFTKRHLEALLPETLQNSQYNRMFEEFGSVLKKCNFSNPRKVKRILNHYILFLVHNQNIINEFRNGDIVRVIILAEYYPELFLVIKNDTNVISSLSNMGKKNNIQDMLKQTYGFDISPVYEELLVMNDLFSLIHGEAITDSGVTIRGIVSHLNAIEDIVFG